MTSAIVSQTSPPDLRHNGRPLFDVGLAAPSGTSPAPVLSWITALPHRVHHIDFDVDTSSHAAHLDALLLDTRGDLALARDLAAELRAAGVDVAVIAVLAEAGLVTLSARWAISDFVVEGADAAEVDARLTRAIRDHRCATAPATPVAIDAHGVLLDEHALSLRVGRAAIPLTLTEFKLLRVLYSRPGHVFARARLLAQVWGNDAGPQRTSVTVHVARIRRKLGPYAKLIRTVRNVGYQFTGDLDETPSSMAHAHGAAVGASHRPP